MTELEQYISTYFDLKEEDIRKIAALFKPQLLKKGEFFLEIGALADRMSFVQSGFLRVFAFRDEKEVTQWISGKGFFVTDIASFTMGSPSRWNMQALTDVELFSMDKVEYDRLAELVPQWPEFEKYFIVNCFTFMENRIFSHLSMTAEERYDYFYSHNKELFTQVPQQYIASMLGMTPETFSRIRKRQIS